MRVLWSDTGCCKREKKRKKKKKEKKRKEKKSRKEQQIENQPKFHGSKTYLSISLRPFVGLFKQRNKNSVCQFIYYLLFFFFELLKYTKYFFIFLHFILP